MRRIFIICLWLGWAASVAAQDTVVSGIRAAVASGSMTATTCTVGDTTTSEAGCIPLDVGGWGGFTVQLVVTGTNTTTFEVTTNGTTWRTVSLTPSNSTTTVTTATASGIWTGGGNYKAIRARVSSYTSGSSVATIRAGMGGGGSSGGGGGGGGGDASAANQTSGAQVTQIADSATNIIGSHTNALDVYCTGGTCGGGTTDTDDGTVAGAQVTGLSIGLNHLWDGTNWKRQTFGTAGTAGAQVLTVQGITAMTPLLVTPTANSAVNVAQINGVTPLMGAGNTGTGSPRVTIATDQAAVPISVATIPSHAVTNAGTFAVQATGTLTVNAGTGFSSDATNGSAASTTGPQIMGKYSSSTPTAVDDGDAVPIYTNASGAVHTVCDSGCSGGTTDADDASVATGQTTGLNLGLTQVYDGSVWRRFTVGTAGTSAAQVVSVQGIASGTALPISVATIPSHAVTNAGTFAVQATGSVSPIATTTGGSSTCYLTSAASTNSTNCKGSAGTIYSIRAVNTTTTNYFLRLYNASSAPTCSSATGFVETIPILGAAANGGGIASPNGAVGADYGTGIGFCLTGGGGNTDNTNAATGVYVTILYK